MNKSEELIACLEGEIAKRDARIVELESGQSADMFLTLTGEITQLRAELAAFKAIIDGLRGEVVRIESEWKDLYADQMELVQERDQLRAEAERLTTDRNACWEEFKALRRSADAEAAELRTQLAQQQGGEYGDAYQGAREDLAIWKHRALEAEEKLRVYDSRIVGLGVLAMQSATPQPSAVPVVHGLDADDVRAACQNAVEVFAEEQHAELCREVAEYMREVLLVDLDRAAPVQGEADYDAELHASWLSRMTEICKEYRTAEDGADVRDVWKSLMAHLDCQPASMTALTDGELRAGIAIQRSEIDRLRQQLRDEGDRIAHLRTAMETILPYVKDKRVTGRKPLKDGVYTMHIGQIIRDALDAVQPPASATPPQPAEDYPACDYCGCIPDHHPWHGSGFINGAESPHIHACNDCRHLLPKSPQPAEVGELEGLLRATSEAGRQLSNAAYNLAQREGHELTKGECALLSSLRKQWDAALSASSAPQ